MPAGPASRSIAAMRQDHTPSSSADALIVGAGPAGLALATGLAQAGIRAIVFDRQPLEALQDPPDDGREIAVTHRARRVMEGLGLWARLPAGEVSALRNANVLNGDGATTLRFSSGRAGTDPLGWLVPNRHIRRAAYECALQADAVHLCCDVKVEALVFERDGACVRLEDGRLFRSPLVVAADGRLSSTRRAAGIGASMRDFGRTAIVGRLVHEIDHDGVAWEHFRHGNTLALLPLAGRQVSAVVTVPADEAPRWLALEDREFAAEIFAQAGGRLGRMNAAGPRFNYPLVGVVAHAFVGPRLALVGDAAIGMHPVTAHGWNLGLYGVEVLVRELAAVRGRDPGAALRRYERAHRRAALPVYAATNAIVGLFTDDRPAARLARRAVLAAAQHLPPVSGWIKALVGHQLTADDAAAVQRA